MLLAPIPRACQAPARPADISAGLFPALPLPAATLASLLRNNDGIGFPGDGSANTRNRHWCLPSPHYTDPLQISVRTHGPGSLPGPATQRRAGRGSEGTRAKIGAGMEFLLSGTEKRNTNIWETRSCPHHPLVAVAERIAATPTWFSENSGSSGGLQGAAGTASHCQPESGSVPPHAGPSTANVALTPRQPPSGPPCAAPRYLRRLSALPGAAGEAARRRREEEKKEKGAAKRCPPPAALTMAPLRSAAGGRRPPRAHAHRPHGHARSGAARAAPAWGAVRGRAPWGCFPRRDIV